MKLSIGVVENNVYYGICGFIINLAGYLQVIEVIGAGIADFILRQVKIKLRPSELGRTEGLDKACQCVSNRILNMVGRIYTVQINIDSLTIQCICASIGQIMVVRLGLHNNCVRGVIMVILGLYGHIEGICDRCSIITTPTI